MVLRLESQQPAFLVDGMLGSIARKLRILGFDTIYDLESQDKELVQTALISGRTLVTSDFELYIHAKNLKGKAVLVKGKTEVDRLFQVLAKSGIRRISTDYIVSRCSVCNGELANGGKSLHGDRTVYTCKSCGKNYWRGSHWKKIGVFFDDVNSKLIQNENRKA